MFGKIGNRSTYRTNAKDMEIRENAKRMEGESHNFYS
jgi:hypothetical protein